MDGIDIALKHRMALIRYNELLDEAAHQRRLDDALAMRVGTRRNVISDARAVLANILLRAGSWMMPEDACGSAANGGLELRPGR